MNKFTILIFVFLLSLFSCTKETTYLTQGQLTAQKLESALGVAVNTLSTKYLVNVSDLDNGTSLIANGNSFQITGDGFIIVTTGTGTTLTTTSFNLGQLKSYQIFSYPGLANYTPNIQLYF